MKKILFTLTLTPLLAFAHTCNLAECATAASACGTFD